MRLIDADKFKFLLQEAIRGDNDIRRTELVKHISNMIDRMSTAYEVEAVVEELEESKGQAFLTLANTGQAVFDFAYNQVLAYLDKAIEIVRKGGVK